MASIVLVSRILLFFQYSEGEISRQNMRKSKDIFKNIVLETVQ